MNFFQQLLKDCESQKTLQYRYLLQYLQYFTVCVQYVQ